MSVSLTILLSMTTKQKFESDQGKVRENVIEFFWYHKQCDEHKINITRVSYANKCINFHTRITHRTYDGYINISEIS